MGFIVANAGLMAAALLSALGSGGCAALDVAAVPPLQLRRHARKCTKTKDKCGLCWWFHRGPGLRKKCRIPNSKKSWLTVAKMPSSKKDGSFNLRIGCVVCRCYHNKDSGTSCGLTRGGHSQGKENRSPNSKLPLKNFKWSQFKAPLKFFKPRAIHDIIQHAGTRHHKLALEHWELAASADSQSVSALPTAEWKTTLEDFRKGRSARSGGTCSDLKNLMRWTLSEAMLQSMRASLRECRCLVLIRDERQGKLGLRFRATLKDLTVLCGVLGVEHLEGKTACDLVAATERAIRTFATINYKPPRGFRGPTRNQIDEKLVSIIRERCHMVVTDCASAELLAQQLGRGKRQGGPELIGNRDGLTSLFPNSKLVGRDRTHACQRLIARPWEGDPIISVLLQDKGFAHCLKDFNICYITTCLKYLLHNNMFNMFLTPNIPCRIR